MGTLISHANQKSIVLQEHHMVGRAPYNMLVLEGADISRQHGCLYWDGDTWHYREQSQNGTLVNDKFVNQQDILLKVGSTLQFGHNTTDTWTFNNDDPPVPYLVSLEDSTEFLELTHSRLFFQRPFPSVFFFKVNNAGMPLS